MNKGKRGLTGVAGVLLICLLAIGTVSAYDVDTACTNLKEVVAGSDDLTALELVAEFLDGSVSAMKLWTESVINPEERHSVQDLNTFSKRIGKETILNG